MVIGDSNIFAIDYEIRNVETYTNQSNGSKGVWLLGSFRFFFSDYAVGDIDRWVTLDGCVYWLEDMIKRKIYIDTRQYSNVPAKELIHTFRTKSIIDLEDYDYKLDDAIKTVQAATREDFCEGMDLYQSASIEYIGERSWDHVLILMTDGKPGTKRFIIQQRQEDIREFIVKTEYIISTVQEFINSYNVKLKDFLPVIHQLNK
jgi:hypothetical protein